MLVLVDTSIWVDLFSKLPKYKISSNELESVVTCPPVIQEVLQGITNEEVQRILRDRFLALKCLCDPLSMDLFLNASEIYSHGRRRGLTIRSSFDCLIAAIAIKHDATVWHRDRDFDLIAKYTGLKILTSKTIS